MIKTIHYWMLAIVALIIGLIFKMQVLYGWSFGFMTALLVLQDATKRIKEEK